MILDDEKIIQFQTLYRKHFGKELSREDVYEKGTKLLRLMSIVYKQMTEKEFNFIQERRKTKLPLTQ